MGEADSYYKSSGHNTEQPAGPSFVNNQPGQQAPMLNQQQYPQDPYRQPQQWQPQPQPQQPPPGYSHAGYAPPTGHEGEKYTFSQAFRVEKPKYNDLWAGILFLLCVAGFAAVSGIALYGYARSRGTTGTGIHDGSAFTLSTNTVVLFALALLAATVLSYGYVMLARAFPKVFIWATGILNIAFALGTAVYMLYHRYWSGGIVFALFGLWACFFYWAARRRVPFSALMLRTAITVSNRHGHVYLVGLLGGLLAAGLAAWFAITLVAIHVRWQPDSRGRCLAGDAGGSCSSARVIGLAVFCTFTMYWMSEWLKNTMHATVAGIYGSWYYHVHNPPAGATRGALRRSLTYSFGSICLGSLIVAVINLLRNLCSAAQQQDAGSGDIIGCAFWCVANCLLGILEWVVEWFNKYAFIHVALYGKPYVKAAKDTWTMIKDRGLDALVNDCLVGPVLSFGGIFVGYACALLAFVYLVITDPAYNGGGGYTVLIVAFSFLIGFQIAQVFTTPIGSGIDTIFVAVAWNPDVLLRDHRELYDEMVRVYPRAQEVIRVRG